MIKIEITGITAGEVKAELRTLLDIEKIKVSEISKPTDLEVHTEEHKTIVPAQKVEADLKAPTVESKPVTPIIPTVSKAYSVEDLQKMAQQLMAKLGGDKTREIVKEILVKYNVAALTKLEGEQLGQVAEELKALGADA
ncbi:hypothetical protein IX317_000608 [Fusobacterium sp. DD29]|uniref:hypothetical protein n=1 Tax=unclassified Fusobacterium TaxID=2648384 RepID=UPI001B8B1262|nr:MULTISPECIES: hypothetical protein [unclassified Fusobacterium]MBR8700270.1 hypothetical protein [Fusobacterium sp. DD45]MBR8710475.1 hypothetical protein [Fusobacterium sp. DD28]MBR8748947.1 hypothetical protein [Fusobacterium sp. DD29]MBR8751075.1 hypothetical protein [Fusobacterium sp. DD26]MBR8761253.1 hypothetical protein [Fusobacterium sp. DD25]